MEYDPIKDLIALPMRKSVKFRSMAYKLFELGFLRVRFVKRELKRQLRTRQGKARILDVGFGFGPYSDYVLRNYIGTEVTGIEVKDEQVDDCHRYFNATGYGDRAIFHVQDALDLNALDSYDVAIAVDIMEHIEDDVKVMKNIHRALRKGGALLIHTPGSKIDSRTTSEHNSFVGEHVRDGYHHRELVEKLEEAGFSKVDLKFTYGKYGMISWWLMQGIPLRMLNTFPGLALLLPFYYAIAFPFANRFMLADLALEDQQDGKGLLVWAWK